MMCLKQQLHERFHVKHMALCCFKDCFTMYGCRFWDVDVMSGFCGTHLAVVTILLLIGPTQHVNLDWMKQHDRKRAGSNNTCLSLSLL